MSEVCGHTTKTTGGPCQNPAASCPYHGEDANPPTRPELTDKQRRFIEEYTVDFSATQAAIRAGYSEKTAGQIGYQLLQKPSISEAIEERLDRLAMSADEALKRLADWGRGSPAPFLRQTATGEVALDLSTREAQDNLHLVKRVKVRETRVDDEVTKVRTEIELHDAKDAVKQIARAHGLFIDKVEHSGEIRGGVLRVPESPDEDTWAALAEQLRARGEAVKANGDGDG